MKRPTTLNIALALSIFLTMIETAGAMPDPASVFCREMGYDIEIRRDEEGNEYGVCVFPDGSECDEWHYYCKCEPDGIGCWPGEFTCDWPCEPVHCTEAGQYAWFVECCDGLDRLLPGYVYDLDCRKVGSTWMHLCSDCGNGICEGWESKCNCPQDCKSIRVIFVDSRAGGANDGSCWADAYNFLQDALAEAWSSAKPLEIRVAQGVYRPDEGQQQTAGDRGATFDLISGVTLKGGYCGFGEADPNGRDPNLYPSVLSGDLNGDDAAVDNAEDLLSEPTRADNSYHVTTARFTARTGVLDGFVVSSGKAAGQWWEGHKGGGLLVVGGAPTDSQPVIVDCTFVDNSATDGGAILSTGSPTLINCRFINNAATRGGGLYHAGFDISLNNCIFLDNYATDGGASYVERPLSSIDNCVFKRNSAGHGGALYLRYSWSSEVTNCIFIANCATDGGGMYNDQSSPTLTNCTFSGNSATRDGGAMYIDRNASAKLTNCILWADIPQETYMHLLSGVSVATCSNIQDGWPGVTNTSVDPCFAQLGYWCLDGTPEDPKDDFWVDGDYHLKSQAGRWDPQTQSWVKDDVTSLCIDAGNPVTAIMHEPFPNGGIINMGAYGGTPEASKSYFGEPVCETIVAGDINGDCKVDITDFAIMAAHWLEGPGPATERPRPR